MKKLLVALFVVLATPAYAGSITITVVQGGQTNVSKSFTILDADVDRIVASYQIAANASVNAPATRAQVLLFVLKQWMDELTQNVKTYETQKAKDAIVTPSPINPQ